MTDDSPQFAHGRRLFLRSIGALGAAAAAGPAAASHESSTPLDEYRRTLRDELTAESRQQKQLPPGTYVYGTTEAAATEAFSLRGAGEETAVSVDTDAVPITTGERLEIPGGAEGSPEYAYRGEITDHSFEEGDLLLAVAYVRSDSDDAEARAVFGYGSPEPGGSENFVRRGGRIDPNGEWMRYFFPIEVGPKPEPDAVPSLAFRLGRGTRTVEFGGIALVDYGDADVSLGTLPPYDYEGRSEDAEWRDAARERIRETRTREIEVEVRNPGGRPMPGATVDVEMTEHEFDFGSAVSVDHVTGGSEDDETYRETFLEDFNKAVVENGMKYPAWESAEGWEIDRDDTRATLDWLNERDVPVRGHYLLWEQFDTAGGGGMAIENHADLSADEIRRTVSEKIRTHANEFEGQVTEWDVHNHPIWQSNFRDDEELGWDAVDEWWSVANEATDHELYTNEMGVVGGTWQRSQYDDYVAHLVENDYPLGGIAFMGHHQQQWNQMLDVAELIEGFETFAEYGVPLLVSEFDIQILSRRNAQDVAVQTDYLRDFLTVAFSQPAVEGVLSWGFWADDHWRPTGAYYDSDWSLRPHGEKYRELVFDRWWTEETGETDDDGVYTTRGFKGSYTVTAEKGALSGEATAAFDDENGTVTVELTPPSENEERDSDCESEDDSGDKPKTGSKRKSKGASGRKAKRGSEDEPRGAAAGGD